MMITRDNYESFFLDYLEGNLEENQIDHFLDFLEKNPDLKEELQLFENINLTGEQIVFPEKQMLYKKANALTTVTNANIIAYVENDMDFEERKSFETYLSKHPEIQKEYNLFAKAKLIPDSEVKFQGKNKLYRKSGTVVVFNWVVRAAAVVLLLWGINALYQTGKQLPTQNQQFAEVTPTKDGPIEKSSIEKITTEKTTEKNSPEPVVKENVAPEKATKINRPKIVKEQTKGRLDEKPKDLPKSTERDIIALAEITPITAMLESEHVDNSLAVKRSENVMRINDHKVMSVEEFLANRAKKVGNESFISAQRIARAGLGIVSELSGETIGYSVKNGKISSLDFENKLMAFSIPLKKK